MERPFDLHVVKALVARAIKGASGESRDVGDWSSKMEGIASEALSDPARREITSHPGRLHALAGFELAVRICCRVLADPLHTHGSGVKRKSHRFSGELSKAA
jgi:hypothetical protein